MQRPPPELGERIHASAGPWNARGECVVEAGPLQLRVPGLIPGEQATLRVTGRSRGGPVGWAEVDEVRAPAPGRRTPPCAVQGTCGACALMHCAPPDALRHKVDSACRELPRSLAATLRPEPEWIRSPEWDWRHKAVLLPALKGTLLLGGFARGTHDLVDLPDCLVLAPSLRTARAAVAAALTPLCVAGSLRCAPPGRDGPGLRALVLRANRRGQVLATAVVRDGDTEALLRGPLGTLVREGALAGAFSQRFDAPGDAVHGPQAPEPIAGVASLDEDVAGVSLPLLPLGFFQVNPAVLDGIVLRLRALLDGEGEVLDAYCGAGALGLGVVAGKRGATPVALRGCDVVPASVQAAAASARRLGVHANYVVGTLSALRGSPPPDLALVDPPRRGCTAEELDELLDLRPARIAYLSCSPRSLGRDAERLLAAGYAPKGLWAADMLPQTPHLELLALLHRG